MQGKAHQYVSLFESQPVLAGISQKTGAVGPPNRNLCVEVDK
jgi:hypothetical protein